VVVQVVVVAAVHFRKETYYKQAHTTHVTVVVAVKCEFGFNIKIMDYKRTPKSRLLFAPE